MADFLVIVESPAKATTIERYLGKKYKVRASLGHLRDLPRSQMGVDVENNSNPAISPFAGRVPFYRNLKKKQKKRKKSFSRLTPTEKGKQLHGIWPTHWVLIKARIAV